MAYIFNGALLILTILRVKCLGTALAVQISSEADSRFLQRAIQDLTFNRGARVITGPAVTDLDFNKEMAIFGNSGREIHKIFYFPIARYDFWVLGITEQ